MAHHPTEGIIAPGEEGNGDNGHPVAIDDNVNGDNDANVVTADVCIIGSGPHALAVLSALHEPFAQLNAGGVLSSIDYIRATKRSGAHPAPPKVVVVSPAAAAAVAADPDEEEDDHHDRYGSGKRDCGKRDCAHWLHDWESRFRALGITLLRSPASAHPDMFSAESLPEFAREQGRQGELIDVGARDAAELTRHMRGRLTDLDEGLFDIPTEELFIDFCRRLSRKLPHDVVRGHAVAIEEEEAEEGEEQLEEGEASGDKQRDASAGAGAGADSGRRLRVRVVAPPAAAAASSSSSSSAAAAAATSTPRSRADSSSSFSSSSTTSSCSSCSSSGGAAVQQVVTQVVRARHVVVAIGAPGPSFVPESFRAVAQARPDLVTHTNDHAALAKIQAAPATAGEKVLVVGGGLSAVQAAIALAKRGAEVVLAARRPLMWRHFDLPIPWFDRRTGPGLRHEFFSCERMEDRPAFIKSARSGGTVPPWYKSRLAKSGVRVVVAETIAAQLAPHPPPGEAAARGGTISGGGRSGGGAQRIDVTLQQQARTAPPPGDPTGDPTGDPAAPAGSGGDSDRPAATTTTATASAAQSGQSSGPAVVVGFDRVVLGTGSRPDCLALPLIAGLQAQWPIDVIGGLPAVDSDLRWAGKPVFVCGGLAGLRIGPDALNLMGSRRCAEEVAQSLGIYRPLEDTSNVFANAYSVFEDSSSSDDDDDDDNNDDDNDNDDGEQDVEGDKNKRRRGEAAANATVLSSAIAQSSPRSVAALVTPKEQHGAGRGGSSKSQKKQKKQQKKPRRKWGKMKR